MKFFSLSLHSFFSVLIYESTLFGPLAQLVEQLTLNQRVRVRAPHGPLGAKPTSSVHSWRLRTFRKNARWHFCFLDKFLDSNLFFIKINVKKSVSSL